MSRYGRTANMSGGKQSRGGAFGGGTFSIMRDEWVIMRILLPYLGMLFGMLIVLGFAAGTRLFIWLDWKMIAKTEEQLRTDTWVVTGVVILSGIILTWLAWIFWGQRKALIIKEHAALTVALAHVWWLVALWENYGKGYFSRYTIFMWVFGCIILGLSWCLRNWAASKADEDSEGRNGSFGEIGLGDGTHLGKVTRDGNLIKSTIFMGMGKTVDDAKAARSKIAAMAGKPLSQVHVRDTANGDYDKAELILLKNNPFADVKALKWAGAFKPGDSIVSPIEYATYEDTTRPQLYLAGKDGGSSEHFLVMGMSGVGKSKAWQAIHGTVLSRSEVNLIYIDPAKGIQTAGPLLKGIDLFADSLAMGKDVIDRLETCIIDRTNYLGERGLSQWESGCGINFLIVHIEEAARFARVKKLIELVEAARSAGIQFIFSLQRAEGSRLNTNTRYNLGASMCFGTYGLRDAEFALSEYTRNAGAIPHHWQNRFPGRHYLEASGLDPRMFAMSLQVDWIDTQQLGEVVEAGKEWHTPMDTITANALGKVFSDYRSAVDRGDTYWQSIGNGLILPGNVRRDDDTQEIPPVSENNTIGISAKKAQEILWEYLTMKADDGITEMKFKDIVAEVESLVLRKGPWINGQLKAWVRAGNLPEHAAHGMYYMPRKRV
jgi:hypothetical protein